MIEKVKGTQDIFDLRLYNYIASCIRSHMNLYHFSEIQTPLLEHVALFTQTLGTHTDVVTKEMFTIKSRDENEENPMCLRPEATAGVMRAFLENHISQTPWRVFLIGPMFRYERPQKGRLRQFHQWNIEIIGEKSILADAELILMLDRFFHEQLHMNNYTVQVNFLGCKEDRKKHYAMLHNFIQSIDQSKLCANCVQRSKHNLLRIFDCKEESCQIIYQKAPKTTDVLCSTCLDEWNTLRHTLALLSVSSVHNSSLVRGLDYYTKTVFEFVGHHGLGAQSAFCGGGRYDELAHVLESKEPYPSIGAGIGIERLLLMLEPYKDQFKTEKKESLVMILPYDQQQHIISFLCADELHAAGIACEILFDGSVKSRMRRADREQCDYLFFIGSTEQEQQSVTIKNMKTGQQDLVKMVDVVDFIQSKITTN